jgi:hypothetical protein
MTQISELALRLCMFYRYYILYCLCSDGRGFLLKPTVLFWRQNLYLDRISHHPSSPYPYYTVALTKMKALGHRDRIGICITH